MKIAILSRNAKLYSTKRLIEAGQERGHEMRVIDHIRCFMDMGTENPSIHYKDEEFNPGDFDAVIPRIGASVTFYGTSVVRQFEIMGTYCVNESVSISRSRD
jgi:ribosomal protein S6--L-glutamate ligase